MSKIKLPPAPPAPNVVNLSHCSVEFDWSEIFAKLYEFVSSSLDSNEKITSEILMQESKRSNQWRRMYLGYATNTMVEKLESQRTYAFRLRFKIRDEWCPASESLKVTTKKEPVNGEDIHKAVRSNNPTQLQKLLQENRINIEVHDGLGFTPLMIASQRSLIEIMEVLIAQGADMNETTESGKTALMLASFKGECDAMEVLINHGVDLEFRDKSGMSVLHYAVDGENLKSVRKLMATKKIDVNVQDYVMLWTPLLRCAGLKSNGNVQLAKELIKMNADVNLQDREGNTALHLAVLNNHLSLCELLINSQANIHLVNKSGSTSVKLAVSMGNLQLRELFETIEVK